MKASYLYRIVSVLLILFAAGHTLGFRQIDPRWGIDGLGSSMQGIRFEVQGFSRSYWDFYVGFGLFVSVLLLFAAVVCWQLGGMEAAMLRSVPWLQWSLVLCFITVTILTWRYFFIVPLVFSSVITVCLILAAILAAKTK